MRQQSITVSGTTIRIMIPERIARVLEEVEDLESIFDPQNFSQRSYRGSDFLCPGTFQPVDAVDLYAYRLEPNLSRRVAFGIDVPHVEVRRPLTYTPLSIPVHKCLSLNTIVVYSLATITLASNKLLDLRDDVEPLRDQVIDYLREHGYDRSARIYGRLLGVPDSDIIETPFGSIQLFDTAQISGISSWEIIHATQTRAVGPKHEHETEETYVALKRNATVVVDGKERRICEGREYIIPPYTGHQIILPHGSIEEIVR
jgi:hypothetical protein